MMFSVRASSVRHGLQARAPRFATRAYTGTTAHRLSGGSCTDEGHYANEPAYSPFSRVSGRLIGVMAWELTDRRSQTNKLSKNLMPRNKRN